MNRSALTSVGLLCCLGAAVSASAVDTYPSSVTQFTTPWYENGSSGGGSAAMAPFTGIDTDGSARLRGDRTRFATGNVFPSNANPGPNMGLLAGMTALNFQWEVTSLGDGSTPTNYGPALRVHAFDPATGRRLEFVWENGEQSSPVPAPLLNAVHTGDFFGVSSRVYVFSAFEGTSLGRGIFTPGGTLVAGSDAARPLNQHITTLGMQGSSGLYITGLSLGVGSFGGHLASYEAYADHLNIAVTGGVNESYNFVTGADTALTLATDDSCVSVGEQLVVNVDLADAGDVVLGGQFFLSYDETALDFVSAAPGNAPFTEVVYSSIDEGAGTIDYAVGVPPMTPGAVSGRMATLTFNVIGDACDAAALVQFRPAAPPTRVTNIFAQSVLPLAANDLGTVTLDQTPPVVTVPSNITVKAAAGTCSAVVNYLAVASDGCSGEASFLETGAPGTFSTSNWAVDRFTPGVWAAGSTDPLGGQALRLGIRNADRAQNRPSGQQGAFYNTQGRRRDGALPQGWEAVGSLYIPASWTTAGNLRRSDLWTRDAAASEANATYPIVGFVNNDPADPFNPTASNFQPRFRVFDSNIGDWVDLADAPNLNAYNTLRIKDTGTEYQVYINGALAHTLSGAAYSLPGSEGLSTTMVQGYNFGDASNAATLPDSSYDIYWKDVASYATSSSIMFNCSPPSGSTFTASGSPHVVSCTAIDGCGNMTTQMFSVTVLPVNEVAATVELNGISSGTFTRCINFDFYNCPGGPYTAASTITFVNGVGSTVLDVPCGVYTCAAARDRLHTLRSTDSEFHTSGTQYVADFTSAGPDDSLIGGNLNDDEYIDILDFGGYIGQFGFNYGTGNTNCATPALHADVNGDGAVDAADFSFIQTQFLFTREPGCCAGMVIDQPGGPRARVSSAELVDLDMADLRTADVNHDGWLDTSDVVAFLNGARPCPSDFNRDGQVTSTDFFDFLTGFFAGDADFSRDGATTSDDFFLFLNSFFTGC